jgi:hypothetical protein
MEGKDSSSATDTDRHSKTSSNERDRPVSSTSSAVVVEAVLLAGTMMAVHSLVRRRFAGEEDRDSTELGAVDEDSRSERLIKAMERMSVGLHMVSRWLLGCFLGWILQQSTGRRRRSSTHFLVLRFVFDLMKFT